MSATDDVLAPGTRLDGLEIERVLGAGGFGVTYLARDLGLDAWRAVKEYLPQSWGARRRDGTVGPRTGSDAEDYRWGLERFLDEARMLARFKHPHIVQVHRVFQAGGTAYMVMEYVEGRTLASAADAEGPLEESRVREVLDALTDGLSSVHEAGLLHRDISPDNVMLRPDGTPVLIDFGAARHGLGEHSGTLSSVLKPGYAPLEQYPPGRGQGPWTDIYGLGALAYWALSGARPTAATERTRRDPLRPLSAVAARGVSPGLSSAVVAALSVYPEDRPKSLDEWRALLHGGASWDGAVGVEGLGTTGSGSGSSRRWWPAATSAGLAVAVLALAWLAYWSGGLPDGDPTLGPAALTTNQAGETVEPAAAGASGEETPEAQGGAGSVGEDEDREGGGAGAEPGGMAPAEEEPAAAGPPPDEAERGLGLDRAAWREIQEGLTASGFDPGAADGLVGAATRSALRAWQSSRGASATGYADAEAVSALREAAQDAARVADQRRADLVAAEREAEAQRRAEREAAEREAEAQRQFEEARQAQLAAEREAEAQRQAEEARQAELAAEAERRRPGRVFRDCDVCPEMVVLPGGGLAMGRFEVTVGEYRAFASATGGGAGGDCVTLGDGDTWRDPGYPQTDRHPVACLSWDDAQEYVSWLSRRSGAAYRLPSEAEWERAAAGSEPGCDRLGRGSRPDGTCPVGLYGSNAGGLSDMVGNLAEWTSDCWEGDCGRRVLRGGSWFIDAEGLRPGARYWNSSADRLAFCGFRVSRTLD